MCSLINSWVEAGQVGWTYLTQGSLAAQQVAKSTERGIKYLCDGIACKPDILKAFSQFAMMAKPDELLMIPDPASEGSNTIRFFMSYTDKSGCICTKLGEISRDILTKSKALNDRKLAFTSLTNLTIHEYVPRQEYLKSLAQYCSETLASKTFTLLNRCNQAVRGSFTTAYETGLGVLDTTGKIFSGLNVPSGTALAVTTTLALYSGGRAYSNFRTLSEEPTWSATATKAGVASLWTLAAVVNASVSYSVSLAALATSKA